MTMIMRDIMAQLLSKGDKHITVHIRDYMEQIKVLFAEYLESLPPNLVPTNDIPAMIEKYNTTLRLDQTSSKKYYKVISLNKHLRQPIVHTFILKRDDDKFYEGDILLPDWYRDPFRIKSYGNIYLGNYRLAWNRPLDID